MREGQRGWRPSPPSTLNYNYNYYLQLQLLPNFDSPPRLRSHQAWRDIPFASRRVDGAETDGVVDKLQEIGMLRRHRIVDKKSRDDLASGRIEPMPSVGTADSPSPCNHLPSVQIVPHQFDYTLHEACACVCVNVYCRFRFKALEAIPHRRGRTALCAFLSASPNGSPDARAPAERNRLSGGIPAT